MDMDTAIRTIIAAPFMGILFATLAKVVALMFKVTRPDTTGQWSQSMDHFFAMWQLAFGLLNFASTLETLLAIAVIVSTVVKMVQALFEGF